MFDEKEYREMFSQVTASSDTHRRILNMTNKKKNRPKGVAAKAAVAAIMISLLTVTVSASEIVQNWFTNYLTRWSEEPLTTEQLEFVEENQQEIHQSITQDGYTMELKSVITDGEKAYICVGITAPEDQVLNATVMEGYDPAAPQLLPGNHLHNYLIDENGNPFFGGFRISSEEDQDGLANTQDLVFELTADSEQHGSQPFGTGKVWTLCIEQLIAKYRNTGYMNELIEGKYQGQDNCVFTVEESELLYPEVVLTDGVWEFEICFDAPENRELELIKTPISTTVCTGWTATGEAVYTDVKITSFVLRSFSATVQTDDKTFAPDFLPTRTDEILVIMEDGSSVQLDSESGGPGEQHFRVAAPILLDKVDHVLLPDGTKLPMS